MKKERLNRVNSLLKEIIVGVIQKEVRNPEINTFISVTRVDTSADLHHAKVFVSLVASDTQKAHILRALQSAAGFIALHASKKVRLRYFPQLVFYLDTSLDRYMQIEKILGQLEKERQSRLSSDESQ